MLPGRLLAPSPLLLVGLLLAGCAKPSIPGDDGVRSSSDAIINGTASPASQDGVVLLRFPAGSCSGSLVARNVVLTARHCVAELDEQQENVKRDFRAADIQVFVGRDAPRRAEGGRPAAVGRRLFVRGRKMLPDVALLVLDRPITNAPVVPIRLEGGARKGEPLTIVGYGITENGEAPDRRMQRTGKTVTDVAPATVEGGELGDGEFTFGEAACSGDSGGPALSARTGAVVGVASRVGNGEQPSEEDRSNFCRGSSTINFYTALEPVKGLVEQAFAFAQSRPTLESGSDSPPEEEPPPDEEEPPPDESAEGSEGQPPAEELGEEGTPDDASAGEGDESAVDPSESGETERAPTNKPRRKSSSNKATDEGSGAFVASTGCQAARGEVGSPGLFGIVLGVAAAAILRRTRSRPRPRAS